MPTQHDYISLATALETLGDDCVSMASALPGLVDPALLTGGTVGALVQQTVDQAVRDLSASSTRVGALVAQCRERAEQCRRYTMLWNGYGDAMAEYQRRAANLEPGAYLGSPPYPPRSPGTWAQRG